MGTKEDLQLFVIAAIDILIDSAIDDFSSWVVSALTIVFMLFKVQKMYNEKKLAKLNFEKAIKVRGKNKNKESKT